MKKSHNMAILSKERRHKFQRDCRKKEVIASLNALAASDRQQKELITKSKQNVTLQNQYNALSYTAKDPQFSTVKKN